MEGLNKREEWDDRNLTKFNKGSCTWDRINSMQPDRLGTRWLGRTPVGKDLRVLVDYKLTMEQQLCPCGDKG